MSIYVWITCVYYNAFHSVFCVCLYNTKQSFINNPSLITYNGFSHRMTCLSTSTWGIKELNLTKVERN